MEVIAHYKKIGSKIDVLKYSYTVNQITVDNFAFVFNCRLAGSDVRLCDGSDLKTYLLMRVLGYDVVSVVGPSMF